MKNFILLIALLVCGVSQAQVTIHIHYTDGTTLDIDGADIDSVYYPLDPMNHVVYLTTDDVQSDAMVLIDSVTFSGVPPVPMSCFDGIQNNGEDAPDCGGPCPPCGTCQDGIQNEIWVPSENDFFLEEGIDCGYPCVTPCVPSCDNGIQDGDEEGIDCGGDCPEPCPPPTCIDGVWNGLETGVDCGGPDCPPCPTPTCDDGIQNQNETGIDCGGVCPEDCPEATCFDGIQNQGEEGIDCGGPCPAMCPPESCNDGVQNQGEEWIDCGGPCPNVCPTCDDGIQNGPEAGNDCVVGGYPNYYDGMCPQCPTCFDNIINNSETYVDCGGPNCPDCEQYLNTNSLEGTTFIGEAFTVEMIGSDMIFSATQTEDGLTRTLRLKVPNSAEESDNLVIQNYTLSPSIEYVNYSGTTFQSQQVTGSVMIISFLNDTPVEGLNYMTGAINLAELIDVDTGSGTTIELEWIVFGVGYE